MKAIALLPWPHPCTRQPPHLPRAPHMALAHIMCSHALRCACLCCAVLPGFAASAHGNSTLPLPPLAAPLPAQAHAHTCSLSSSSSWMADSGSRTMGSALRAHT